MKTSFSKFVLLISLVVSTSVFAEELPQSPSEIHPLIPGTSVPSGEVQTVEGDSALLTDLFGKGRSILIFYRGGWCPYCNKHLDDLQKYEQDLIKLGYKVVAFSPDKPAKLAQVVDDESYYTLYSDSEMEAAKGFGVAYQVDAPMISMLKKYKIDLIEASGKKHQQLPVPAVFIIDDGVVEFTYVNPDYKTRLSGEVLLAAAKFAKKN
ncbi:MAG: AhpC/TSA family protein [Opitutales bacterium]|nr:AhpC/TSA family protein [Opitutales bacterium]